MLNATIFYAKDEQIQEQVTDLFPFAHFSLSETDTDEYLDCLVRAVQDATVTLVQDFFERAETIFPSEYPASTVDRVANLEDSGLFGRTQSQPLQFLGIGDCDSVSQDFPAATSTQTETEAGQLGAS